MKSLHLPLRRQSPASWRTCWGTFLAPGKTWPSSCRTSSCSPSRPLYDTCETPPAVRRSGRAPGPAVCVAKRANKTRNRKEVKNETYQVRCGCWWWWCNSFGSVNVYIATPYWLTFNGRPTTANWSPGKSWIERQAGQGRNTHHIIAFFFDRRYELTKLLKAICYHLLIVGLRRADALEVEFIETLGQSSLRPG